MRRIMVALLLLAFAAGSAAAQTPCGIDAGGSPWWVVRWVDDGTERGRYEVLPCEGSPPPPTPTPEPDYPPRVVLLPINP